MKRAIHFSEAPERLELTLFFRRQWSGMFFGLFWLAGWWAAAVAAYLNREQMIAKYGPFETWAVLACAFVVGLFVLVFFAGLVTGYRRYSFSPEGITKSEKRLGRLKQTHFPAEQIRKLRPFPGVLERLIFDFGTAPVGIELPLNDVERQRLLEHPATQRFRN